MATLTPEPENSKLSQNSITTTDLTYPDRTTGKHTLTAKHLRTFTITLKTTRLFTEPMYDFEMHTEENLDFLQARDRFLQNAAQYFDAKVQSFVLNTRAQDDFISWLEKDSNDPTKIVNVNMHFQKL